MDVAETDEARKGLRNRWMFILPSVFVTYSLAYLDRANYGFGAAAGMARTLNISESRSALLGALFFLGYFLFQLPGTTYARRKSARTLVFFSLVGWGALASLTGLIRNFWLLAADRFLLGVAESFILPALLILLTNWFTREERSRANTLLILGNPTTVLWMSLVTGYLIRAVGWQMAFVYEGIPSIVWGFFWFWLIRDHPHEARWMNADACSRVNAALSHEQTLLPSVTSLRVALKSPNVVLLGVQYFFWSLGVYGFVLWLPTVVQNGASRGIAITGLLSAMPYVLAVILMLIVGHFSDRARHRERYVWPFLILSGAALLGSYLTISHSFWWAYGFLIIAGSAMYAPYGPFFAIIPDIMPRNVAGEVTALVNSCGALGGFAGTWFVGLLQAYTGSSRAGFLLMSISLMLAGWMISTMRRPAEGDAITAPAPVSVH